MRQWSLSLPLNEHNRLSCYMLCLLLNSRKQSILRQPTALQFRSKQSDVDSKCELPLYHGITGILLLERIRSTHIMTAQKSLAHQPHKEGTKSKILHSWDTKFVLDMAAQLKYKEQWVISNVAGPRWRSAVCLEGDFLHSPILLHSNIQNPLILKQDKPTPLSLSPYQMTEKHWIPAFNIRSTCCLMDSAYGLCKIFLGLVGDEKTGHWKTTNQCHWWYIHQKK